MVLKICFLYINILRKKQLQPTKIKPVKCKVKK